MTHTPRPHGEYLGWIDEEIGWLDSELERARVFDRYTPEIVKEIRVKRASLLANRDVLERHEERQGLCHACSPWRRYEGEVNFPCPTYTDITKHLDLVMGERNV